MTHRDTGKPPRAISGKRLCSGCGTVLGIYNKSKTCNPCARAGKGKLSGQGNWKR